ncbi:MAG: hypothetical protein ACMUHU_02370 [Thermoplasmatota archaeon]
MTEEEGSKEKKEVGTEEPEGGPSEGSAPQDEERIEVFDEDEKELFEKLMKKIQDAGDLEKELDSDFESFEERVGSVVDSVDRIEKIERSAIEDLAYKQDDDRKEEVPDEEITPETEETREKETVPAEKEPVEPAPSEIGEPTPGEEEEDLPPGQIPAPGGSEIGQVYLPAESPYEQIKKGEIKFDYKGDFLDAYGSEVDTILKKMLKLVMIKIEKEEMDKARNLFLVSASIGGGSSLFQKEFIPLADILDIEVPDDRYVRDGKAVRPTSIDGTEETKVLDPDLADEIGILQKKAASALKQLESLITSSNIEDNELKRIKVQHVRSMDLYKEKRFHKSYEVALEALEVIKNLMADSIDNRIQTDLYQTKEMLEEFSKKEGAKDQETVEELRTTLDRAMKAYLTNEFERATLLTKKVLNTILDARGDKGGPLRKTAEDLKRELRQLKELNLPSLEFDHMMEAIHSAETFIDRRDVQNAEKIFDRIKGSIEELRERSRKYVTAREMEIKLVNRIERLDLKGPEIDTVNKKFDYIKKYFKEERYDDILVVGQEIEHELDHFEEVERDSDTRKLLDELEGLMGGVDELEDPDQFRRSYEIVIEASRSGDMNKFRTEGQELLEKLTSKLKTAGVDRTRHIARSVVEGRLMTAKLQALNIETTDHDRKLRKARTLLKEGKFQEGLSLMEETNNEMKKSYLDKMEYIRDFINVYRDSLEVVMDRHKDEPIVYYIRRKQVPVLRKLAELGSFHKALEHYRGIESKLTDVITTEEKKENVGTELNDIKFEIYKRKEEGVDISEPLSLYTQAQKWYNEGQVVSAEFLIEVSRRYCDTFIPN